MIFVKYNIVVQRFSESCVASVCQGSLHSPGLLSKTFRGNFFSLIIICIIALTYGVQYKHTPRATQLNSKQNAPVYNTYFAARQLCNPRQAQNFEWEQDLHAGVGEVLYAQVNPRLYTKGSYVTTPIKIKVQGKSCYAHI